MQHAYLIYPTGLLQEAAVFRRLVLAVLAGLRHRHGHFLKPPYSLASLADDRTTPEYAAQVVRDFNAKRACCHRPGLAQTLRLSPLRQSLGSPEAKAFFHSWALSATLSLSDTERQHSVNKRHNLAAGGGLALHQLAAQAINHSARSLLRRRAKQQKEHEEHFKKLAAPAAPAAPACAGADAGAGALQPQTPKPRSPKEKATCQTCSYLWSELHWECICHLRVMLLLAL